MRIDKISNELQAQIVKDINEAEDKGLAIAEGIEKLAGAFYEKAVRETLELAQSVKGNKEAMEAAGIRTVFNEEEKKFYSFLKMGAKQSVTADQIDIIPTNIIDATLNDVKQASRITSLITFAPAGVQKWLTASKTGSAVWGALTASITGELTATITALNLDVHKLNAFCAIPKAIRALEIGYVDKYFRAILAEAMQDGIAAGYLDGDGKVAPIGVMRKFETNSDGTYKSKTVISTVTGFSPEQLAPVLQTLSHGGIRPVQNLTLVCNPLDEYQYVNPALYGDSVSGGYIQKSAVLIDVIADANCEQGKAVFTMPGLYTMGFQGVEVQEYKETGALDDVDYIIAKVYGNGRAVDVDAAVVIDVTSLVPYILPVTTVVNP